jgi:predicted XRE-type DNA-binding protein
MNISNQLAIRVHQLITDRGLTQTQVAADLGVTQPTVSTWFGRPSVKGLQQIIDHYDLDLEIRERS